jgi:hypothetical protein
MTSEGVNAYDNEKTVAFFPNAVAIFAQVQVCNLCTDHQAEDRQQPLCQGIPGLGPPHRPGEGDHGGHDGVQDAQVARQSQLKIIRMANHSITH